MWDQSGYVNISRRKPSTNGAWQNIQLTTYRTTSTDSHNVISMGIAPDDGTIHLAYDMHASQLRYVMSANGLANNPDTATWSAASFGANQTGLVGLNQKPLSTW